MFSKGFFFIIILLVLIVLFFILRIKDQQTGNKSHRTVGFVILGFLTVSGLYYMFSGNNGSSTNSSRRHYYPWYRYSRNNDSHHDNDSKGKLKEYKKSISKKSKSKR